jgi:hypothetical protein
MKTRTLLLAATLLAASTCAHAGQVWCVAKTTANILDAPSPIATVVRTITKRDGYVMLPDPETDLALKGWHAVSTYTRPGPTKQPGLMVGDTVGGYVKADAVHCQLGGG